ncbi:MAG: HDOD domain-containing protein [Nitrospiraceae bacterium]|nr:MAG: HDOD domain-containing protein [Nitrospiraceae bacterium]
MNESLKLYVQKIKKLPTLPVIAQEVLKLVNSGATSVGRIEQVVENDPAISAKILSVANSVFFGVKTQTKTLDNAIMRIGFDNLKSIALGISLMTVLQEGKSGKVVDYNRIYNHSVSVGFVARLISRKLKQDFSEEIMISGMLHDLGYLIMNRFFPDMYMDVLSVFEKEGALLEAEQKVLEFTHADIGHWLSEKWNLPKTVQDTTLYHHTPSLAKRNSKRAAVVHIADYITTKRMLSPTEKDPDYPFDYSCLDILNITEADINAFEAEISGEDYTEAIF